MRGEASDLAVSQGLAEGGLTPEKQQEQELMGKLAASGKLPARPASSFLQKKLQQRKFFDSGDYAMDKSKAGAGVTGRAHPLAGGPPTLHEKKPTNIPSRPNVDQQDQVADDANLQIPRPDTVPQRKASIINPSVHCKLSPAPHVQHHDASVSQASATPE
ncbi:unnamed protein product [Caenorhabditis auriculariae]|uniref:cAMP-regulated phosphoprotein 19 n=1 Tax=Caenorhabditis auriculariae TaxID=2777116 RepID=A0A8S1HKK9_9PELO|nr:unnamed protein product [Caenorhabditis auriculariae]